MMRHLLMVAVIGAAFLAAGCGKKPEPVMPPPADEASVRPAAAEDDAEAEAARRAAEEAARREAEENRRRASTLAEMVFFDYDVSAVREDQKPVLNAKAEILRAHPSIRIRIEGHADDRGSTEYNLALGSRRAEAVREYLVDFGLDPARFEMTSYGEERPLVQGQSDVSWARNRRGEFVVLEGAVVTSSPGR